MAHKARRRPSWKKANRWKNEGYDHYQYVNGVHCYVSREAMKKMCEIFKNLDIILQEEIDKEILEKLREKYILSSEYGA